MRSVGAVLHADTLLSIGTSTAMSLELALGSRGSVPARVPYLLRDTLR